MLTLWPVGHVCLYRSVHSVQLKGREPEWPNPKLNVGNCLKGSKMDLKPNTLFYQITQIFKNVNYLLLMKCILNIFSRSGGLTQHLWVRPLWFSALQLLLAISPSLSLYLYLSLSRRTPIPLLLAVAVTTTQPLPVR